MAQLALAAAGAAIGGALAGPGAIIWGLSGAQLGWMGGSMLGAALAPKNRSYGPRLDELRVSGTEYGGGIAWVAGAPRVAGDLIWASDRREIVTTEEAGKGGGSSYTSYTYEIDAMYLLADQPGAIVTRCWDNGKLIWTNLASADDASRIASEQTEKWRRITVNSGGDAQLPDPTYEAAVLNAPAYTRRLTVFIEGLQLGAGGTLPNLTWEVASASTSSGQIVRRFQVIDTGYTFSRSGAVGLGVPAIVALQPEVRVVRVRDGGNPLYNTVWRFDKEGRFIGTATRSGSADNYPGSYGAGGGSNESGGPYYSSPVGIIDGQPARSQDYFYAVGTSGRKHLVLGQLNDVGGVSASGTDLVPTLVAAGRFVGGMAPCSDGIHFIVFSAPTSAYSGGSVVDMWHIGKRESGVTTLVRQGTMAVTYTAGQLGFGNSSSTDGGVFRAGMLEDDLVHFWTSYGAGQSNTIMYTIGTDDVLRFSSELRDGNGTYPRSFSYNTIWAEGGYAVVFNERSFAAFRRAGDVIDAVPLQDVVQDLCDRATMPAGTYDASALASITQPVRALAVTGGSARQALEILQTSHGFDAFVTDKLYFVPRGGAPLLTIDADDLAAGDGDAVDQPFALTVNADLETPGRFAVVFKNMAADQINGTENSDRGPSGQDSIQTVQLAIGMLPAEAKGVADAMVRDAYAARLTSTLSLPMGYTKVTPTDVLQVPDSDGTLYRMRVTRRSDSGGIISLDVVGDDGTVVVQQMPTSTAYTQQTIVQTLAATVLVLLDIPMLRDADDGLGMYLAARGDTSPWPGCIVYRSNDGVTFTESVADISEAAVLGVTTSVLASWSGGSVFDRVGSVLVNMGPGQLASATADQVLADSTLNALLIGSELVRFTTAALQSTAPNIYKVSGLLRGQRGTEWATGTHALAEPVVLLRTRGLRRIPLSQADLGQTRYFKGVTKGALLSDAVAVSIVPYSILQKPLAPADLRASRDVDGNMVLSWKRRTRMDTNFTGPAGIVVPLGESSERYEIDIVSGTSVVRTAAVTEASFEYTASMQTADFGGLQGTVSAQVYQLGANGRGYPLAASAGGSAGASIVRTVTLGGIFTAGLTINVRAGSLLLVAYTVQVADVDLDGVATAIAAAITAGTAGYSAVSAGPAVTVTGPVGVSYTLTADVSGASSMEVGWYVQKAATATAGTRYSARVAVAARFSWGAGGMLTAGTVLGFTVRAGGATLPPVQHLLTYAQDVQTALTGLQLAFQGSAIEAAGYQLTGNTDAFGYHLRLTRVQAGRTDALMVDQSSGQFYLVASLATLADQGSDPIVSDQGQISDVTIYGTPQTGEVYRVELGPTTALYAITTSPTNYDYTALPGETAEDIATGLAAVVDAATDYLAATSDRGIGGDVNTVRITGAIVAPFTGAFWSVRAFIQRAITTTIS